MLTGPKIIAQFIDQCRKDEKDLRKTAANYTKLAEENEVKALSYRGIADEATSQANAYANAVEEVACSER